jgi:nicotinamide-nucleotide amidase
MKLPRAALLSAGDELLGGRVLNTNAAYLAQRLTEMGFLVTATETVGDDEFAIADSIKSLCARADTVLIAGGLGPTPDDVTREALAGAAGKLLVNDRALRRRIARRTRGRAPRRNARMARIPEGAIAFPNPVGVAAGLRVDVGGTPVYALPGVPMELEAIFENAVAPDLAREFGSSPLPVRTLRIFGLREAEVAERLEGLIERGDEPAVSVTVRDGVVTIKISGDGAEERAGRIRDRLGDHVFGEGEETLAGVVLRLLSERGLVLATAESLTAGMVASFLAGQPGASNVLRAGVVAYDAAMKHELLGVPKTVLKREGVVSAEVALRMARGCRRLLEVDVAVSTTGVAGPGKDEHGNRPGHGFVACAGPRTGRRGETVLAVDFGGARNTIRRRFAWTALDLVRRQLGSL